MKSLMKKVKGFVRDEEGQGMAEYALILALVAIIVIIALRVLGPTVGNKINQVSAAMS